MRPWGYFDTFRTPEDRQANVLDYSSIQAMLANGEDWQQRYLESQPYQDYIGSQIRARDLQESPLSPNPPKITGRQTGFWHQFSILTRRNFKVLRQDKIFLGLVLALGPLIGLLNSVWGSRLFEVESGSPSRIITAMFMAAFTAVLVGVGISVREIVRETAVYQRERALGLDLFPYIFSKLTIGKGIAFYQSLTLTFFLYLFVLRGSPMTLVDYLLFFVTIFLGVVSGYLIGLVISAVVPNQNWAYPLVIAVLLIQYFFCGVLVPVNRIPAGELISMGTTTRWGFEALVNVSGIGHSLVTDACWQRVMTTGERAASLTQEQKDQLNCSCMGVNIFTQCSFPGIRSEQIYPPSAQQSLAALAPQEPLQPTVIPTLTPVLPTQLPTFTPFPTPTYLTTDQQQAEQDRIFQATLTAQQTAYEDQLSAQNKSQQDLLNNQMAEYESLRQNQLRRYNSDLSQYALVLENWQTNREKVITAGESSLQVVVDHYGASFQGNVFSRWLNMVGILLVLFGLLVGVLKLKEPR